MKKVDKQAVYKARGTIAKYFIALGIALNVLGWLIIILNVKSITPFVFLPFWYGYILLADGINYILKKHSLIINQPKYFLLSLILSLIFWGIFEVYNYFIFHGWQYMMPPTPRWIKFTFALLAWATVLPGLLETIALVEILYARITRKGAQAHARQRIISAKLFQAWILIILLLVFADPSNIVLVLSLGFWGAFAMLLDPILYLTGKPSLIRKMERGNVNKIIVLLISGYVCGFLWELWNNWAGAKWIYTATWLQDKIKIFEMPVRGLLGFGPFAISMYVLWRFSKVILNIKE